MVFGPEFARVDWHKVGAAVSVVSQLLMGVAALSVPGKGEPVAWACYGATYLGIAATYAVVRRHRSPGWWIVWPVACVLRIVMFGLVDHAAAQLVLGLIFIFFLFAGLTQPQGRTLFVLLPLALVSARGLIDLPFQQAAVRLVIAAISWSMASELPAFLLRRHAQEERALATAAETDSLTGVRNRLGLSNLLHQRQGQAYLVIVDLDEFKRYNDTYGHLAGDRVLVDFAAMLRRGTRRDDVIVRYGGEEFVIVLADVDRTLAEGVVQRWADAWQRHDSEVTFSAGITDLEGDDALRRADASLYAAKQTGRNRTVVRLSTVAVGLG